MTVQAIRGVVEAAIQRASQATGVDFSFLLGTAKRESGYNPSAHARTSSAAGLFQFVDQTWLATLKKHGAKYGYARYAELISEGTDGRYYVSGGDARQAVMDLRLDPHAAALMAGELATDHASYLRGRMGRDPTAGELYAAHVLGPQGSARLIEAVQRSPNLPASEMFPEAAAANRPIFYRDGRPASVTEVYDTLTRGATTPVPASQPAAPTYVEWASERRTQMREQERALVDLLLRGPMDPEEPGDDDGIGRSMFSTDMLRVLSDARDGGRSS
ncbi:MAG TPA: transglycosylase SLT domain-containing protein [Caulobacteraceae bacterium]|nr:transglycosylase SLT domain-containing protein [Caulobacteraceae bacterium]